MDLGKNQVVVSPKPTALEGLGDGVSSSRDIVPADLPPGLSDQQLMALRLLNRGREIKEAAAAANVNPGTIGRWKRENPAFKAAWAMLQEQRFEEVRDELKSMGEDALLVLRMAIAQGDDPRLSLMLLKLLGYFKRPGEEGR